ncbi:hypothetical protein HS088_TW20G00317 [Tripterygium wilfordii]|uniref:rRNA biogenesis protein RRP36 n=1 Tax=Tripterygium wilfordii TaxID=458696 RepID=A0A7J7C770_TRIWF|nr:ribosomal RNA processing protein 36 homolog [Tripterygium wilfordii]KAF5729950.1 hypothetical protein HS088_TW20G00317 [Tripterygium wilfordii]
MRITNDAIASSSKTQLEKGQEKEHEFSSSSEEEEDEIERELADVTFEELQKARSNGSHTIFRKPEQDKKAGRANKNRPMEVSCKKPVSRFKEVVQAPKRVVRDPRFESLCGALDEEGFRKRYSFLYEENLPAEKEELEKQVKKLEKKEKKLKKTPDLELKEELKNHISLIDKQLKSEPTKTRDAAILAKHKKEEREAAKKGKQPFYLKKSEIRKQRLVEKFNKLKASGKLESFIEKRRKRNASKDHRYMPYRRSESKE